MMIYNLVFICVVTVLLLWGSISTILEDEIGVGIIGLCLTGLGIIAIVFQSINL